MLFHKFQNNFQYYPITCHLYKADMDMIHKFHCLSNSILNCKINNRLFLMFNYKFHNQMDRKSMSQLQDSDITPICNQDYREALMICTHKSCWRCLLYKAMGKMTRNRYRDIKFTHQCTFRICSIDQCKCHIKDRRGHILSIQSRVNYRLARIPFHKHTFIAGRWDRYSEPNFNLACTKGNPAQKGHCI